MADLSTLSDEALKAILSAALKNQTNEYADKNGPIDAALIGAGKTTARIGQGMQQAWYGLTGNDQAAADLKAKVADENARYAPLAAQHPLATGLGEALPSMAIPIGGATGLASVLGRSALASAAPAAMEYGSPQERLTNAAGAGAAGAAGGLAGVGIGRALQPVKGLGQDAINATKALFDKYNVEGLPGQVTGSAPLQWMESALSKLPGGGRIRDVIGGQQTGLNRVAMDTMGATGDAVTPESVQAAKSVIGQTFNDVPKTATVAIDDVAARKLVQVEGDYYKNLSPDQRSIVRNYVDDILAHSDQGMPGEIYQKARSRIAARANSTQDSELKSALTGVYKALDDAFNRSADPSAVDAMATARSQWRAAKTIEPMANESGNVSPARLANGAKGMPGQLGDLAKLGQKMKQLPDSGTAQRLFYQSLLAGGAGAGAGALTGDPTEAGKWAAGTFAGPWIASQLLTRAPIRQYLTNGLMNVTPEMQKQLIRSGGLLGLSGLNALTNQ